MRAIMPLVLGFVLVASGAAAETKQPYPYLQPLKNTADAKAETQKEITRNLRRNAPVQGPKSGTQQSSSKAK